MRKESELEIIVGAPPKRGLLPRDIICSEFSPLQEFLFDWLDYVPSTLKTYLNERADELGMAAVYVTKYYNKNKPLLKCYFTENRIHEPVHIPPYNFFQKNDTF